MIKIINATYFISVFFSQIISAQEPLELFWEDMVPPDYQAPNTPLSHEGSMLQMGLDAPIVKRLNGKLPRHLFKALTHRRRLFFAAPVSSVEQSSLNHDERQLAPVRMLALLNRAETRSIVSAETIDKTFLLSMPLHLRWNSDLSNVSIFLRWDCRVLTVLRLRALLTNSFISFADIGRSSATLPFSICLANGSG